MSAHMDTKNFRDKWVTLIRENPSLVPGSLKIQELLGMGTSGAVYKADFLYENTSPMTVAIKCCTGRTDQTIDGIQNVREYEKYLMLKLENHPNFLPLIGYATIDVGIKPTDYYWMFMMPYAEGGTLSSYMQNHLSNDVLSQAEKNEKIKLVTKQLVDAVEYMHEHKMAHQDFKSDNILVKGQHLEVPHVWIGDLGSGWKVDSGDPIVVSYHGSVCTATYRSPELFLDDSFQRYPLDVWSLGIVLWELIECQPNVLWNSATGGGNNCSCNWDMMLRLFQSFGTPNEDTWPGVSRLEYWNDAYPKYAQRSIKSILLAKGYDWVSAPVLEVVSRALVMCPAKRSTAQGLGMMLKAAKW